MIKNVINQEPISNLFFHESHEYEMYEDYEEPVVYDKAAETDEDA